VSEREHLGESELAAIEERCKAAAPGPWEVARKPEYDGDWITADRCVGGATGEMVYDRDGGVYRIEDLPEEALAAGYEPIVTIAQPYMEGDADFIAAARTDIPRLIAALREAREALRPFADAIIRHPEMLPHGATIRIRTSNRKDSENIDLTRADFERARAAYLNRGQP